MSTISLRDYDRPHTSPLLRHSNSQLLFVPIIHCDGEGRISTATGSDWRRGCRITRAIYRATKKVLGLWMCPQGQTKRSLSFFETLDVAVVLALCVFNVVHGIHAARRKGWPLPGSSESDIKMFLSNLSSQVLNLPAHTETSITLERGLHRAGEMKCEMISSECGYVLTLVTLSLNGFHTSAHCERT
ncbi:hypothetical protein DPX16_21176 [Anabarilius grahami]|uniref:Uncharacterized protein n=1 Tax=Anabarilius grahami TaxID=495550 RepID=A0A3N0Z2P6_ANAGA|nr:hypothetical protein DPX16_21176 [Anabarilius grahami]